MQVPALSPLEADALVQLRALLTYAKNASRTGARMNRLVAVVLLDGVNERVTHLACTTLGVEVTARTSFEDMASKLKEKLGSKWSMPGWSDVRKLHRVRNGAQHEGAGADRDDLAGWRVATEKYANGLVVSVFGVHLDRVVLADCIANDEIRASFAAAEEFAREGNVTGTVLQVREAYDVAQRGWRITSKLSSRMPRFYRDLQDPMKQIDDQLHQLSELSSDQVFASDPAELMWFTKAIRIDPSLLSIEEAERALAFAFWWIVAWESAAATFVDANKRQWDRVLGKRRVRRGTGPAWVSDVTAEMESTLTEGRARQDDWEITFHLSDVPATDEHFDLWNRELVSRIAPHYAYRDGSQRGARFVGVDRDGTVRLRVPANADWDHDAVVQRLNQALIEAEEATDAHLREAERRRAEIDEDIAAFSGIRDAYPELASSWLVSTEKSVFENGRADISISVDPGLQRYVLQALRDRGEHWFSGPNGVLRTSREVSPEQLAETLMAISNTVLAQRDADAAKAAEYAAKGLAVVAQVREAMARVQDARKSLPN